MNKLTESIYKLIMERKDASGDKPATIPMRRDEIVEIIRDTPMVDTPRIDDRSRIFGVDTWVTPYAEEIRTRRLEMPLAEYINEASEPRLASLRRDSWQDLEWGDQHRRLVGRICQDTTEISVTFEWDILARWKRLLRITKWFPIKTRTVKIEGRVLYPYLNVTLPENRHTVQFVLRP